MDKEFIKVKKQINFIIYKKENRVQLCVEIKGGAVYLIQELYLNCFSDNLFSSLTGLNLKETFKKLELQELEKKVEDLKKELENIE